MKKIYSKGIAAMIMLSFITASCKKSNLDTVNPNAQTTETFWKTSSDAVAGY
jgi:hypothetical protein